jgi:glutamate formiminotransferase
MRPVVFRVDGLAIQATQPTVARPQSKSRGVVLELGNPTVVVKLGLHGVPASALQRICNAVGSAAGGLLHIGAYPAISKATGEPLLVLECTDPAKSPLERALDLVDIEAQRYGGALGAARLLSAVPLQAILDTLAARMSLGAQPAQIIETHLAKSGK